MISRLIKSGELYNVEVDISEKWNKATQRPELVDQLKKRALELDRKIGNAARPTRQVEALLFDPRVP